MKDKWEQLKQIVKIELARLEEEIFRLEDLKMVEKKNGLYEKDFNQHRAYAKVLSAMRRLEKQ